MTIRRIIFERLLRSVFGAGNEFKTQGPRRRFAFLGVESLENRDLLSLVPISGARDLIYDQTRQYLYVTTPARVERFDVANQVLKAPFPIGSQLNGGDITPNGEFLYVADGGFSGVRKLSLDTGISTIIPTGTGVPAKDVVITNNGTAYVNGGSFAPHRRINLANDTISTPPNAIIIDTFDRSPDRSKILGRGAGLLFYSSSSDTFSRSTIVSDGGMGPGSVNRDGTLFGYQTNFGVVVFDGDLRAVETLGGITGGMAFSPTSDLLVAVEANQDVLIGYETTTWTEKFRIPAEEDVTPFVHSSLDIPGIGRGKMTFSSDGSRVFLITNSGVRQYSIPQSTGVATSLKFDSLSRFLARDSATSVTLTVRDPAGNVATGYRGTVQFSAPTDPFAVLPAPYTFTADDNGSHTFVLTFGTLGSHTLTASDSASALTAIASGIQVHAPDSVDSLPIANSRDLVFDALRNRLYITTASGRIERYDVATQSLLSPWTVTTGGLYGADISPDGRFLFVNKEDRSATQAIVLKVSLDTGQVTTFGYNQIGQGGWDGAIAADGVGLFVDSGTGFTSIHVLDSVTGVAGPDAMSVSQRTPVVRSADGRKVFVGGVSYDATTHAFGPPSGIPYRIAAASRDGALLAFMGAGTVIYDGNNTGTVLRTIPRRGGIVFDPTRDVLYIAEEHNGDIYAYDTVTWSPIGVFVIGQSLVGVDQFGNGTMAISGDSSHLFVRTPSGIRHLDLAEIPPTPGSAGGPYVIGEGAELTLNGTAGSDPDASQTLSYSWDINNDGFFTDATGLNPTLTWFDLTRLGLRDGPDSRIVHFRVHDGTVAVEAATTTLTVNNSAPAYGLSGAASVADNKPYSLIIGSVNDPGSDTITSYQLDWGDGTVERGTGSPPGIRSHTYMTGGQSYNIVLSVTDEDGTHAGAGAKTVTVTAVPPTATQLVPVGTTPGNTTSKNFQVTFSEAVTGVDPTDFVVSTTGPLTGVIDSVTGGPTQYVVAVSGITGNGTIGVNLINDGTIKDLSLVPLSAGLSGTKITIDQTPPVLTLTGKPASPSGSTAQFTFGRSDPTVGGVSSGMSRVEYSLDGEAFKTTTSPLTINNVSEGPHSIAFRAIDNATNISPFTIHEWLVDIPPYPVSISRTDSAATVTQSGPVGYTVTFDQPVTGVDLADFVVPTTGDVAASANGITGSGAVYFVTIASPSGDGTIGLNLVNNNTIFDLSGKPLAMASGGIFVGQTTNVDHTAPSVSISLAPPATAKTGDARFVLGGQDLPVNGIASGFRRFEYRLDDGPFTGSTQFVYEFNNLAQGTHTLEFRGVDNVGNVSADVQYTWAVDLAPAVAAIVPSPASTNGQPVTFSVTFSEPVVGVDLSDFRILTTGAVVAGTPTFVGSGSNYSVTIPASGNGTVALKFVDDRSVRDSTNTLMLPKSPQFDSQQTFSVSEVVSFYTYALHTADIDGDGFTDILTSNYFAKTLSILYGNGDGTFRPLREFSVDGQVSHIATGDFNGDGRLDIYLALAAAPLPSAILFSNLDGSFTRQNLVSPYAPFAIADLNADGKLDVLSVDHSASALVVILGNGDGTFQNSRAFANGFMGDALSVGDVNNDGKLDVVVIHVGVSQFSLFLGTGTGGFQTRRAFLLPGGVPRSIALADQNGDGKLDVLATTDQNFAVSLGNGSGLFATAKVIGGAGGPLIAGDFDRDGFGDAAYLATALQVVGNSGNSNALTMTLATGGGPEALSQSDFNRDGRPDIVVANRNDNTVSIYFGRGSDFTSALAVVDQTPPGTTIISRPPAVSNNASPVFEVAIADPVSGGVSSVAARFDYQVDGGAVESSSTSSIVLSNLTEGVHTFEVRSVDAAGNVGPFVSYSWRVVLTPPAITGAAPASGLPSGGAVVTIVGTGFYGVTSVNFGATASPSFTVISPTQIVATSPPGSGTVDITVVGVAGPSASAPSARFSYVKLNPVLSWFNPADIIYGTALSGAQLNASANVPGVFVYGQPVGTVLHAGVGQVLTVTFTPADSIDYAVVQRTVLITVKPAALVIRANNITVTGQYAFSPAPSATYLGLVNGDTPSAIAGVSFVVQTSPPPPLVLPRFIIPPKTPAKFGPGSYSIFVSGGVSLDYVITYVAGTLTVLP